ncbi:unnamed protein product [Trichogramma brassicae]|uniref:Uncharacterized protein n=1 Tax=Trichogramma brassicae TaxID=86971 RepID=A0A6H5ITE9_9HYME|nr:unnamed protein product [Trichogramma brassicae]
MFATSNKLSQDFEKQIARKCGCNSATAAADSRPKIMRATAMIRARSSCGARMYTLYEYGIRTRATARSLRRNTHNSYSPRPERTFLSLLYYARAGRAMCSACKILYMRTYMRGKSFDTRRYTYICGQCRSPQQVIKLRPNNPGPHAGVFSVIGKFRDYYRECSTCACALCTSVRDTQLTDSLPLARNITRYNIREAAASAGDLIARELARSARIRVVKCRAAAAPLAAVDPRRVNDTHTHTHSHDRTLYTARRASIYTLRSNCRCSSSRREQISNSCSNVHYAGFGAYRAS